MAKRKKTSKKKPSRRPSRGRRVLMLGALLLLLGAGAAAVLMLKGPQPEAPVAASVAQTAGSKGAGNGNLDSPRGLAVAPNGDVYVADLSNGRIAVFGPEGAFKRNIGKLGPEPGKGKPGEFNEPSGVAVGPDGTVYVADAWNGRIQKLGPDGKPLGEYGGARYSFYSPRNVAVDRNSNVYVADTGNSRVRVIDPNGKVVKDLGGKGSGGGQFNEVFGVAVNSRGEVFAADPGNKKLHKFSALPGGDFVKDVKVPGWQTASPFWPHVAVDAQDNVYAVDPGNRKIWVYDSELKYRGTLGGPAGELFASPLGLGFGPDGQLWVSDQANSRLLKLAPFDLPAAASR
jgi:sugar lactone lactonase YvrE